MQCYNKVVSGERILTICLAVWTQYRIVSNRQNSYMKIAHCITSDETSAYVTAPGRVTLQDQLISPNFITGPTAYSWTAKTNSSVVPISVMVLN